MAASRAYLQAEVQALETAARALDAKIRNSAFDSRIELAVFREAAAHMLHVTTGLQMCKFALSEFQEDAQ